jgi:ABC-type lipoprotein release transport system permease subunit
MTGVSTVLFKIAFRNLWSRKVKIVVIGLVIVFGSFIAVLGGSFVESVTDSMRKSLTNSIAGEIQIYSADAKEKLSVTGGPGGNFPDVAQISNFVQIKKVLEENIPEIKAVVPQGVNFGMLNPGNILDIKLSELRNFKGSKQEEEALIEHIRLIIRNIKDTDVKNFTKIAKMDDKNDLYSPSDIKNLDTALAHTFWAKFEKNRNDVLEFLENKIAPLIYDESMIFFLYMGTIPDEYIKNFPLVEIIKGTDIPSGQRGYLFNEKIYEEQIKHKVAVRLDSIKKDLFNGKESIAKDKELQGRVKANMEQISDIYNQMNPLDTKRLIPRLKTFLNSGSDQISELLIEFFNMNDANFMERYDFFYEQIAPKIILYKIKIGEVFPLKTFTRSGYANSVNLKVYGVFRYRNFEDSPLISFYNLMDIMSFRELYGYLTAERKEETRAIAKEMEKTIGSLDVAQDDIASMFGDGTVELTENKAKQKNTSFKDPVVLISKRSRQDVFNIKYTPEEMENGICLNAAIVLKDYTMTNSVIKKIEALNSKYSLNIKVLDWRDASGPLGQFTYVIKWVLYAFIAVIFLVAIFVIMNSMLMATLERTREIGTMRAIGAQRSYVLKLILSETLMMSSIFGFIGIVFGVSAVGILHEIGIPAPSKQFYFLFSGPKLYPSVELGYILAVFVLIIFVSLVSSYYPSYRAAKVAPIEAMQRN